MVISVFEVRFLSCGTASSARAPIFPRDRAASRQMLQSLSSKQYVILSTASLPDLSPSSPKTYIELKRTVLIRLSIFFITSLIIAGSFSILARIKSILASLNNCSKEAEIFLSPSILNS